MQEFVIPEAEAEWVGLTLDEAVEKQRLLEEKVSVCEHQPRSTGRQTGWGNGLPLGLGLAAAALGGPRCPDRALGSVSAPSPRGPERLLPATPTPPAGFIS